MSDDMFDILYGRETSPAEQQKLDGMEADIRAILTDNGVQAMPEALLSFTVSSIIGAGRGLASKFGHPSSYDQDHQRFSHTLAQAMKVDICTRQGALSGDSLDNTLIIYTIVEDSLKIAKSTIEQEQRQKAALDVATVVVKVAYLFDNRRK